jgi:hypothetical protein
MSAHSDVNAELEIESALSRKTARGELEPRAASPTRLF